MPDALDKHPGGISLSQAWRPLSRRVAVAAGSFVALISLFQHVPVSVASLRGGAAFAAVLIVTKLGLAALEWSLAADRRAAGAGEEQET